MEGGGGVVGHSFPHTPRPDAAFSNFQIQGGVVMVDGGMQRTVWELLYQPRRSQPGKKSRQLPVVFAVSWV